MNKLIAPQIHEMHRSEVMRIDIDWGENTSGDETGVLKAGDTIESCVVTVVSRPPGALAATDPDFGTVTVNLTDIIINGRTCSAGEATTNTITTASDVAYGRYMLQYAAVTVNDYTPKRGVTVNVRPLS